MGLFTEHELKSIELAVEKAESSTYAEIVTVFARQADSYYYIPTLVASMLALISPWALLMTPLWLELFDLLFLQFLVFVVLALVLRFRPVLSRLVPKFTRDKRSSLLARYQFLEQNLHTTENNLGVLIFICELERQVEILVDHGIAAKIDNSVWQKDVDKLIASIAAGETFEGIMACLVDVGDQLAAEFPATKEKSELCNKLVLI